jgi:hypothetical protein
MSPSRAAHDALPRRARVRGVAGPYVRIMPRALLVLESYLRRSAPSRPSRPSTSFNDTTALSALVTITMPPSTRLADPHDLGQPSGK